MPRPHRPECTTAADLLPRCSSYGDYARRLLLASQLCPERWIHDRCRAIEGECVPCEVRDQLAEIVEAQPAEPPKPGRRPKAAARGVIGL